MVKDEDIAWVAGIFEGEGTVELKHFADRNGYKCQVSITNKDISLLKAVQKICGAGDIYTNGHPDEYKWQIQRRGEARKFLLGILPYMKSDYKKHQVENWLYVDDVEKPVRNIPERWQLW